MNLDMEKDLLLNHIMNNYNIKTDKSLIKIFQFKQYPHIFKLQCPNYALFIKMVDESRIHCKNLNQLYLDLSKVSYIEIPVMTKNEEYFSLFRKQYILLYKELEEIKDTPNSLWWSNCLGSIHNIVVNKNYKNFYTNNFYNQTIELLNEAKEFITQERMIKITDLLKKVNLENIDKIENMVLCHNDPYNLNVMQTNTCYKLIDTDGMGLSPKEYDIQRLLYNNLINSNDIDSSLYFWDSFKENYEANINGKININLLKNIYILDLIRTTSWLYIICNNISRKDRKRQQEQLNLFEKSFDNNNHCKILKVI